MRKVMTLFLIASIAFSLNAFAKEIAGISLEPQRNMDGQTFTLQGAGVRDKFFMDLYVASLYAPKTYESASALMMADEPMSISLHIISSLITSEKMEEATREGFINATEGKTAPIAHQIETFIAIFKEPIAVGDVYDLRYSPNVGVKIYKNNTLRVSIAGLSFKQALFGIWLGDKPAQESLKKALLGK
ncbi:MAG: chalcone isomerase family protein [Sulfurospirillaceae bacterium]|nr:chalcone isomerase family protein [Sulfurospirillaceae bacterium]